MADIQVGWRIRWRIGRARVCIDRRAAAGADAAALALDSAHAGRAAYAVAAAGLDVMPRGLRRNGIKRRNATVVADENTDIEDAARARSSRRGNTSNNWLGRAQSACVPFYDGLLDDFRVYDRALSAGEISALFALH